LVEAFAIADRPTPVREPVTASFLLHLDDGRPVMMLPQRLRRPGWR